MKNSKVIRLKKKFSKLLAACLGLSALSAHAAPTYFTDLQGRALVLHGLNTSNNSKYLLSGMPWINASDVVAENNMLGTNAVRFVIFWSVLQPTKPNPNNVYNDDYLRDILTRVNWYGAQGMHVILDMHQDLYGPGAFSDGPGDVDGAPVWATYTDGLPVKVTKPWGLMYLQPGEVRAWDNFWGTTLKHPELRKQYADAWQHIAGFFANNNTVIGYDLLNEPYGGSLQGAFFEPTVLVATYQAAINEIRQVDNDHWILVEPSSFPVTQGLPTTLPKPHDPRKGEPRIAYAPHLYPPTLDLDDGESSYTGANIGMVNMMLDSWTLSNVTVANVWKAPLVIGELGGVDYTQPGNLTFVDKLTDLTDRIGASWLWWSNDIGNTSPYKGGGAFNDLAQHLSYPYAQAIAGTPELLHYDPAKKQLAVKFVNKAGVTGTTDLFLSPYVFKSGYSISTTDKNGSWSAQYNVSNHVLSITADPGSNEHTYTVTAQ